MTDDLIRALREKWEARKDTALSLGYGEIAETWQYAINDLAALLREDTRQAEQEQVHEVSEVRHANADGHRTVRGDGVLLPDVPEDREAATDSASAGRLQAADAEVAGRREAVVSSQPELLEQLQPALDYANLIVVESDGWPMEHSAADMRTLLANAFIMGQRHERESASARVVASPPPTEVLEELLGAFDTLYQYVSDDGCPHADRHRYARPNRARLVLETWLSEYFVPKPTGGVASPPAAAEQIRELIEWLLGERGDFPLKPEPLAGRWHRNYWWREELRRRATALGILQAESPPEKG